VNYLAWAAYAIPYSFRVEVMDALLSMQSGYMAEASPVKKFLQLRKKVPQNERISDPGSRVGNSLVLLCCPA
jgi:hypothetical protein